jgi:hypothetical protein
MKSHSRWLTMRKPPQAQSLLNGGLITSLARVGGSLEKTYLMSRSKPWISRPVVAETRRTVFHGKRYKAISLLTLKSERWSNEGDQHAPWLQPALVAVILINLAGVWLRGHSVADRLRAYAGARQ